MGNIDIKSLGYELTDKKVTVVIERGKVIPFEELPDNSIALDGYVQGPEFDPERNRYSFDHHDKCIRHITAATCKQMYDALCVGLKTEGMTIYVNDVDADTVVATWLALVAEQYDLRDPMMRHLVNVASAVDALGPAYSLTRDEQYRRDDLFLGVMQPEQAARADRSYAKADLAALMQECLQRLTKYIYGDLHPIYDSEPAPDYSIDKHDRERGIVMVESPKGFVFPHLYELGYERIISYALLDNGTYAYSIGKKSEFVKGFPVGPHSQPGTILHALREREPGWGGGSTIGGAPRNEDGTRSRLHPNEVWDIVMKTVPQAC